MRSQNIAMLSVCCSILVAIGYFVYSGTSPEAVMDRIGTMLAPARPASSVEPEAPAEPKKAEPAPRLRLIRHDPEPVEAPPTAAVAETPPAAAPERPQPAPADIRAGTERRELLTRFPDPALQTSTLKDGDLIELIVYQHRDQRMATFAQLRNGTVTQVYAGLPARTLPR